MHDLKPDQTEFLDSLPYDDREIPPQGVKQMQARRKRMASAERQKEAGVREEDII